MKVQVLLPATIILSALLMVFIKVRQTEQDNANKRKTFLDIKMRVSVDVLRDYQSEDSKINKDLEATGEQQKKLEEELKTEQEASDKAKHDADTCGGEQVSDHDRCRRATNNKLLSEEIGFRQSQFCRGKLKPQV